MDTEQIPLRRLDSHANSTIEHVEIPGTEELDELSTRRFNGELSVTLPPAPPEHMSALELPAEVPPSALEQLRAIARTPAARFITAGTLLISACESQLFQKATSETEVVEAANPFRLSVTYDEASVRIAMMAGDQSDHEIRIALPDPEADWNTPLPHENAAGFVELNNTFQMHKAIVFEQYANAIDIDSGKYTASKQGLLGIEQKYSSEPSRMGDGAYPDYSQIYNNMTIDNEEVVMEYMKERWELAALHLGVEDLNGLTAQQWMQVLQEPGTDITYDTRLGSMFDDFDPTYAVDHNNLTIDELIEDGKGVCRDIERINVTSYMLANEEYHLAERGLLYVPVVNISDAAHTRGMFMLAMSATETIVVGVDTTNANGEVKNSFTAEYDDTSAWYLQQFGKEFTDTPNQVVAAYEATLMALPDMGPTAKAMMRREIVLAKIAAKDYKGAFTDLQTQLMEERAVTSSILDLPSRLVPLYELFVVVAKEYDKIDTGAARGMHTAVAKRAFADYIQEKNVNPGEARDVVEQIDRMPGNERNDYLDRLTIVLSNLDAKLHK